MFWLEDGGAETLKDGTKVRDLKGKTIRGKYIPPLINRTRIRIDELDHQRRLKKFYKKYGNHFLTEYMKWFNRHHAYMVAKYPDVFKERDNVVNEPV